MAKRYLLFVVLIVSASIARSQVTPPDTATRSLPDSSILDDNIDYDALFNDFTIFLDSLLAPRSYGLLSLSGGQGYFNYVNKRTSLTHEVKKFVWSPTFGYYDKSGFGILMTSYMISDSSKRNWYQTSVSPSYDYISDRRLATGIAYTRYFTKRRLPFYSTPIQNELSGYFLWRKSWLQPGVMFNYGWGSHTEFSRRDSAYRTLAKTNLSDQELPEVKIVSIIERNRQSIVDFSLTASVRHDFYWLHIFSKKDYVRLSPIMSLTGGTQKFGFNNTSITFGPWRAPVISNSEGVSLESKFEILAATLYLRSEYSIGKFFIEPQLLVDYYFPGSTNIISATFSFTTGFMF